MTEAHRRFRRSAGTQQSTAAWLNARDACDVVSRSAEEDFSGVAESVEPELLAVCGSTGEAGRGADRAAEQAAEVAHQRRPAFE
ncbi:MAG: hypothetical protein O3B13_16870 [Planctomycetota bacterium]|nr:hypothetical protein [Planctomycetota bacterium]